ncbi:MAG: hypothetical protein KTR30_22220 [Saprospiraceae bacterium]|nr:hypothetical protein [Saprospiraceae bacterium]
MTKTLTTSLALLGMLLLFACDSPTNSAIPDFPEITTNTKPWTRWWWHGSQVDRAGITAELEALHEAGIGGVELTPIYGVQNQDEAFIEYLSEAWVDLLLHTLQEAERLGLGVDMATGTGWPFGGPWVQENMASKYIAHRRFQLNEGEQLKEKVTLMQSPILRTVQSTELTIQDLKQPITANENLQHLAIDQVRFEEELPLQVLMAYSDEGQKVDLTTKVDEAGQLDWVAPAGTWELYALFQGAHGKMVERAAPGGEGLVIDHFDRDPIKAYLAKFDEALEGKEISSLRAFFNDSYEVDDARGQANWTPKLFEEFEKRRSYDLRQELPALLGEDESDKNRRVLTDYRETISDLLLETFTKDWSNWAREKGAVIRNQAHGSPANILDLYAASDIPETEGTDIIKAKMASSAAHVSGKPLVSAEAATWLGEHFTTNLADLKENIDRYFAAGINHIFYHGTCYSPTEEEWPGRLFYAAIHANPRNSLWHDYPALNQYIARVQSFLQSGVPDNDVLLYFPAYDRYAERGKELLDHFHGEAAPRGGSSKVREVAEWLQEGGFGFDFISDKQLRQVELDGGEIKAGSAKYQVILIPTTEYMPLETLQQLQKLAQQGATIVFQSWPAQVAGWDRWEERQAAFEQMKVNFPKDNTIVETDLAVGMAKAEVYGEDLVSYGLSFHRRQLEDDYIYFVANGADEPVDQWLPLQKTGKSIILYDALNGRIGKAETKEVNGYNLVRLQLNSGEALLIKVSEEEVKAKNWLYRPGTEDKIQLDDPWELSFIKGGPELPAAQQLDQVQRWTALEGDEFQHFSGTASYRTSFDLPDGYEQGILLDLGEVSETATVKVNGQSAGTALGPIYQVLIPAEVLEKSNTLSVEVSNLMANRVMYLEKNGTRWQRYYNINISARLRENLGPDRVFTTEAWAPFPSGLAGPVSITPLR